MLPPFFEQHFPRYQRWFSFLFTKHISTQRNPHLIWDELRWCFNAYKRISRRNTWWSWINENNTSKHLHLLRALILWLPCVSLEINKQPYCTINPLWVFYPGHFSNVWSNELHGCLQNMPIACISQVVPESLASETLGSKVACLSCLFRACQLHVTTQSPGLVLDIAFTRFLDHGFK